MGYDMQLPAADFVLTHARAFALHPRFNLLGGVDPDSGKRNKFTKAYGVPSFSNLKEALTVLRPEVVVIATPTNQHARTLDDILEFGHPRVILCEKPLSSSFFEATRMVERCQQSKIGLFVNYVRRADSAVLKIREMLTSGKILSPFEGVGTFTLGLIHNGTHLIDLLVFWFGNPSLRPTVRPRQRAGSAGNYPEFDLEFAGGTMTLSEKSDSDEFSLLVEFANGTLRYEDWGKTVTWGQALPAEASTTFGKKMDRVQPIETSMGRYQMRVTEEIGFALDGRSSNLCTGEKSLVSLAIASEALGKSWR